MVKFLLVLADAGIPFASLIDWYFLKFYEMPSLPRKSECVHIGNYEIEVISATHYLDKGFAEIICECAPETMCGIFWENKGVGWKIDAGPSRRLENQAKVKGIISDLFLKSASEEVEFDFVDLSP